MLLFQVHAEGDRPFTAGFCVDAKNTVWRAAPIIKWMEEKPLDFIKQYCARKRWKLIKVNH